MTSTHHENRRLKKILIYIWYLQEKIENHKSGKKKIEGELNENWIIYWLSFLHFWLLKIKNLKTSI